MKEHILTAQIEDALAIAEKRPHFLGFLSEAEVAEAEAFLRKRKALFAFWGGYEAAKRKFLGIFPAYLEPEEDLFPLQPVTFWFAKAYPLAHRDFLGAFMALGVERSAVGDILTEDGRCVAFIRTELYSYFESNIEKIGKVAVRLEKGFQGALPEADSFEEITGVVSSPRLDCVAAFLTKQSRDKAADFVKSGYVSVNHREITAGTKNLQEGDVVSVRRHGRFIIDQLGPTTAKGRIKIKIRKYK